MGTEIERKFIVEDAAEWRDVEGKVYRQGYLNLAKERTVRVRTIGEEEAVLTIKGETQGATRLEFEYAIPIDEAKQLLELCVQPLIEKTRRKIEYDGFTWEVDEFYGANEGLLLAEVELEDENQAFQKPAWLGREVTEDPRYYNANLVEQPYREWEEPA